MVASLSPSDRAVAAFLAGHGWVLTSARSDNPASHAQSFATCGMLL